MAAGEANTGYASWNLTDGNGNQWSAYAIKNKHSNATSDYHYLQIKKYASDVAYFIQVPELGSKITSLQMTVSSTSKPMNGGGNTATVFFSSSKTTSAAGSGVVSSKGAASITIDCSSLNLNNGYITASGAVRIWEVVVTYEDGDTPVQTVTPPTFSPAAGEVEAGTAVTISAPDAEMIVYTTDGTAPSYANNNGEIYTEPIVVNEAMTIKAIAVDADENESAVATAAYTIKPEAVSVATVAEFNALADNTVFTFTGNLTVSGQKNSYLYAQDATGSTQRSVIPNGRHHARLSSYRYA